MRQEFKLMHVNVLLSTPRLIHGCIIVGMKNGLKVGIRMILIGDITSYVKVKQKH